MKNIITKISLVLALMLAHTITLKALNPIKTVTTSFNIATAPVTIATLPARKASRTITRHITGGGRSAQSAEQNAQQSAQTDVQDSSSKIETKYM